MRVDTVLTVAAIAVAAYALYLAARGAPGNEGLMYAAAANFGVAGPAGAPFTLHGIPLGYDSAGGPAYG